MTQEQLAQWLRAHPQSISVWERNLKEPQTYLIPRIIEFLGYVMYEHPESFAEWLRMCRRANGLSQERLAEALGMDESTVQKWEAGKHQPFRSSLRRVKGFLRSIN